MLAMAGALLSGCYQNPDPTGWNSKAKTNFVNGCTRDVKAANGTTTTIAIAAEDICQCIVDLIYSPDEGEKGKYAIKWEDLKAYEAKQADAKAGQRPAIPKNLDKAIEECAGAEQGPGI